MRHPKSDVIDALPRRSGSQKQTAARQVVDSPSTAVAIYGEIGVGKELLARAIRTASGCSSATFVAINCAVIPETLLESELFCHVKGAFTGADRDRKGKCWRARRLFLDEIGDIEKIIPTFNSIYRIRDGKTQEEAGEERALNSIDSQFAEKENLHLVTLFPGFFAVKRTGVM